MCGIFGFSNTTPVTRLMTPTLALCMEMRGTDSWGVTDGDYVGKMLGRITDGWEDWELDGPTYHTRAASVGAATLRNAHPFDFTFEGKRVVGVHNGHISNWAGLKRKYNRERLEVDSEHIFMSLAEGKSVADIGGWGAVVWYEMPVDHPEQRVRYFSRFGNMDNLHFAKLKGEREIVFASTRDAISRAARLAGVEIDYFYTTNEKRRYRIVEDDTGELDLRFDETLPWAEQVFLEPVATNTNGGGRHYGYSGVSGHDQCASPRCDKTIPRRDLLCEACVEKLLELYFGRTPAVDDVPWTEGWTM